MENNKKKEKSHYVTILIIGNTNVGKTLLLERIVKGNDLDRFQTQVTIGVEFAELTYDFGTGRTYKVQFIDVPGGQTARTMVSSYYRGVDGIIAVYDVNEAKTFDALCGEWLPTAGEMVGKENTPALVIANKKDLWVKGEKKLTQCIETQTRDLNLSLHDRLMLDANITIASALVWKFPDRETPVDSFVWRLIKRKAETNGDSESGGRISLFSRDVDENGARANDQECAC
jgi:small GTP-binding protein